MHVLQIFRLRADWRVRRRAACAAFLAWLTWCAVASPSRLHAEDGPGWEAGSEATSRVDAASDERASRRRRRASSKRAPRRRASPLAGDFGNVADEEIAEEKQRKHEARDDDRAGRIMLMIFAAPWMLPRTYLDAPCLSAYARRPFDEGTGLLRGDCEDAPDETYKKSAWALDLETGYLVEGVVPATLSARAQLPRRFEVLVRGHLLRDVQDEPWKRAWGATAHGAYRFAQVRRVDFRTGAGVRVLDVGRVRAGFDLVYALDGYASRWSIVRVDLHMGSLGSSFAGEARATLGAMVKGFELYGGYDHTVFIGAGKTSLHGPLLGVRGWM